MIWLHGQECAGCAETLLRPSHPTLDHLILDLISLDYHETLAARAGHFLQKSVQANKGKSILVIEGAVKVIDDLLALGVEIARRRQTFSA